MMVHSKTGTLPFLLKRSHDANDAELVEVLFGTAHGCDIQEILLLLLAEETWPIFHFVETTGARQPSCIFGRFRATQRRYPSRSCCGREWV
jgi:hypothetical protein